jgi:hypothetical protein
VGTRHAVLNVHGLPPATRAQVEEACAQLANAVPQFFGGVATWYVLDGTQPRRCTDLHVLRASGDGTTPNKGMERRRERRGSCPAFGGMI